jgi:hypothetical protein
MAIGIPNNNVQLNLIGRYSCVRLSFFARIEAKCNVKSVVRNYLKAQITVPSVDPRLVGSVAHSVNERRQVSYLILLMLGS